jgi:hypothetical protein
MANALTLASDFKLDEELIRTGVVEATMQFMEVFNEGSNGGVRLIDNSFEGHFFERALFQMPSGFVGRRDITNADDALPRLKVTEAQTRAVKINRYAGPVYLTMDAFKKVGLVAGNQRDTYSLIFGQESARKIIQDKLNTTLLAGRAAINSQATVKHTSAGALITADLIDGMAKFGDAGGEIVAWVMHSKPFYSLVKDQAITKNIDGLSNIVLGGSSPATIGRPVIVTDSDALKITTGSGSGATTGYYTLGLTRDGLVCHNSEPMTMIAEWVPGKNNIELVWQGEYAYNTEVKGFAFAEAEVNPTDATLGNGSNWSLSVDDVKNSAGLIIQSNG